MPQWRVSTARRNWWTLFSTMVFISYNKRNMVFLLISCCIVWIVYTRLFDKDREGFLYTLGLARSSKATLVSTHGKFILNQRPLRVLSGSVHYFRVPPEYWRDRLRKLKACGLNTVDTYVPWNLHEERLGNFAFAGHLNLEKFLEIAKSEGLYVILRPGPYICAEWDLGGLPAWLLKDPNMRLRASYEGFLKAVDNYFRQLIPKIVPYQYGNGGPIIMVQIENEYGSYRQDPTYLYWLKNLIAKKRDGKVEGKVLVLYWSWLSALLASKERTFNKTKEFVLNPIPPANRGLLRGSDLLVNLGVTETLFTSDGFTDRKSRIVQGSVKGVLATVNNRDSVARALQTLADFQPGKPLMIMEYWSGWFDHWTENHHTIPVSTLKRDLQTIFEKDASVNLYMFHGGTNFGFLNGANLWYDLDHVNKPPVSKATTTSYDYDAQISESGNFTDKYYATCGEIAKLTDAGIKVDWKQIELSKYSSPKLETYGQHSVTEFVPFIDALKFVEPWSINRLVPMEQICDALQNGNVGKCVGQNFGFIAYRAQAPAVVTDLQIKIKLADRALLIVDGQTIAIIDGFVEDQEVELQFKLSSDRSNDLIFLVENMGRVNYAKYPKTLDSQRKGILPGTKIMLDGVEVKQWQVYMLDMNERFISAISKDMPWREIESDVTVTQPAFYRISLKNLHEKLPSGKWPGDTFLNYKGWGKGAAFLNGFNLGRYWTVGPQQTLYIPGPRFLGPPSDSSFSEDANLLTPTGKLVPDLIMFELHTPGKTVILQDRPEFGNPK